MGTSEHVDFGGEVSRILPLIMREAARMEMSVFSEGRLAIPHVIILDFLIEKGSCKMGDLAEILHLTMSAVTGIVDKMIEVGLVRRERSREDRRVVLVGLLKKGEQTALRIRDDRKKVTEKVFSALTESEKREYLKLLNKVYNSLRKKK